jgi:hypothetical protein
MILRADMFTPLLAADPSFLPHWQDFLDDWRDEAELPEYLALGTLAEHLAQRLRRGDVEGFEAIFAVVEDWHLYGDAYVRQAATIGLLEALLNRVELFESCRRNDDRPSRGSHSGSCPKPNAGGTS